MGQENETRRLKTSKARDEFLGIQSYNFFSYEQFGVTPIYIDKCDDISGGACWSWCYHYVWVVFDKIANRFGKVAEVHQVLQLCDEVHGTFFSALSYAKRHDMLLDENIGGAVDFWTLYFDKRRKFYKEKYPNYFMSHIENRKP